MSQCNAETEATCKQTSVNDEEQDDATAGETDVKDAEQDDSSDSESIVEQEEISAQGKELAQYVRDLYDSGAKLWTKEMFRDIEAELAKDPLPHAVMIRSSKLIRDTTSSELPILYEFNTLRCCSEWSRQTQAGPTFLGQGLPVSLANH